MRSFQKKNLKYTHKSGLVKGRQRVNGHLEICTVSFCGPVNIHCRVDHDIRFALPHVVYIKFSYFTNSPTPDANPRREMLARARKVISHAYLPEFIQECP